MAICLAAFPAATGVVNVFTDFHSTWSPKVRSAVYGRSTPMVKFHSPGVAASWLDLQAKCDGLIAQLIN